MLTTLRRLAPVAVLAALGAGALMFTDDAGADAADGTTFYGGAQGQPAYFFFDANDTAGAALDPMASNDNARAYNASGVCDSNPALEDRTAANGSDAALWYCDELLDSCPVTPSGRLLGITVSPGKDPEEVLAHSTCWTYPAGVSIERSAPFVYLPSVTAQDPVFDIAKGSSAAEPEWNLDIAAPNGPKSGTHVRASHATVDGSVALHSLGVTAGDAAESASASFGYLDWSGDRRWAEISADDRWVTVSIQDGLTMDPQVCLDSGICQATTTLQYVGSDGTRDSATLLPHM